MARCPEIGAAARKPQSSSILLRAYPSAKPNPPPSRRANAATARSHSPRSTASTSATSSPAEAPRSASHSSTVASPSSTEQRRFRRGGDVAPLAVRAPAGDDLGPVLHRDLRGAVLRGVVRGPEGGAGQRRGQRVESGADAVGLVAGGGDGHARRLGFRGHGGIL